MTKGVLGLQGGNTNNSSSEDKDSILKFLKSGESIVVAFPSANEFYLKQIVSAFDSIKKEAVILPTVVEKNETTLYDKAVKELWNDYDKAKGGKHADNKQVLNKINSLKRQDFVYFGMKDINTGEDIILAMGINLEYGVVEGVKAKAGNNFHTALTKLSKNLTKFPVEITKGDLGSWTLLPYMEDLTPEQEANFKSVKELTDEQYEEAFFRSNEEKQANDLRKFGAKFGFDVTRIGIPLNPANDSHPFEASNKTIDITDDDLPF